MSRRLASVVAVVGLAGTGKSEATAILAGEYGAHVVYFGGVVVDEVRRRGLPVVPENERLVREELREQEGMDVMAVRSLPTISKQVQDGGRVAIDGLYSSAELHRLRAELGDDLVTIAIHAPRWLRKQRLASRPVRPLTPDEVDQRDHFELTMLDKAFPIASADLHVVNDGDLETLHRRIISAFEDLPPGAASAAAPDPPEPGQPSSSPA